MRTCLVLGGAAGVWEQAKAAQRLGKIDGVVAANDAGAHWPGKLDALVSVHGEKLQAWTLRRAALGHPPAAKVFCHEQHPTVTNITPWQMPGQRDNGSSGHFALKVALFDLGFDRAILCGVPMTAEAAHFFHPADWQDAEVHREGWIQSLDAMKGRAFSMSGWTRELLGAPPVFRASRRQAKVAA